MALLGEIRNRPWILIVMIALGLGGFLIMDMVNANQGPGGGLSQLTMGEIDGQEINRQEFETLFNQRYGSSTVPVYQNRAELWNWVVEENLIQKEAEALGLGVSSEEIRELEFGASPSPVIARNFPNQTGQGGVNRQLLDQYKPVVQENNYDIFGDATTNPRADEQKDQFISFWKMQRNMIKKERLQSKINSLVSKGMYTPNWMAEMGHGEQSQSMDVAFVKIPYDAISNEEVSVSDNDMLSFLNDNRAQYERKEELRVLEYVAFDVMPTAADSAKLKEELAKLMPDFRTAESDSNYVLRHSGIIDEFYVETSFLSGELADTISGLSSGSVYGPYVESGEYKIAKVRAKYQMADSADISAILLTAQNPNDFSAISTRADSIITALQTGGANFDSLAVKYTQDPAGQTNGGNFEGVTPASFTYAPSYTDAIFVTGQIGQLQKVRTAFGYYVVKVLSRTTSTSERAKIAYISTPIVPSDDTQKKLYLRASEFISQNNDLTALAAAVNEDPSLRLITGPALDKNAYIIGQLGYDNDTRDMVCWAFSSDVGDVSPSVYTFTDKQRYYDNKYVVVGLKQVLEPGLPELDEVRSDLELAVLPGMKRAMFSDNIGGNNGLAAIASQYGVSLDTARNLTFIQSANPALSESPEPKVIASAFGLEQGQTSAVVEGASGVYVMQVMRKSAVSQATNIPQIRQRMNSTARNSVPSNLVRFMREGADVSDNRTSFECGNN